MGSACKAQEDKQRFTWVYLKEKWASARFRWEAPGNTDAELAHNIRELVSQAEIVVGVIVIVEPSGGAGNQGPWGCPAVRPPGPGGPMRMLARAALPALLLSGACAALAGNVEVSFVEPASFTDAGNTRWDEDGNLQMLARHLQQLGQRLLPDNQVLKVLVLDVDLAGTVRNIVTGVHVLNGSSDFPKIHLTYTLEKDGVAQSQGDEWVTDLDYAHHLTQRVAPEPLRYEKLMLDAWFKSRFAAAHGGG